MIVTLCNSSSNLRHDVCFLKTRAVGTTRKVNLYLLPAVSTRRLAPRKRVAPAVPQF